MENEKKDNKEKKSFGKQVFFFNEEGKLIVQTNNGLWVDGEQIAKMYGDFVCNAKTMGEIIHQLKGIAVEVGELKYVTKEDVDKYGWGCAYNENYVKSQTRCILGASKERIEEYEKELAKQEFVSKEIEELQKQVCEDGDRIYELKKSIYELKKSIYDYNRLPWWKRIFKKIEVK